MQNICSAKCNTLQIFGRGFCTTSARIQEVSNGLKKLHVCKHWAHRYTIDPYAGHRDIQLTPMLGTQIYNWPLCWAQIYIQLTPMLGTQIYNWPLCWAHRYTIGSYAGNTNIKLTICSAFIAGNVTAKGSSSCIYVTSSAFTWIRSSPSWKYVRHITI